MEFGPEIKVDGKRPEWLKDGDVYIPCGIETGHWYDNPRTESMRDAGHLTWNLIGMVRLPANHSHYNLITHTYTVRPEDEAALLASDPLSRSTPDERAVAPAIVERMRKLVEQMANDHYDLPRHTADEARAIVAALEPVDPALLEARQVVAGLYEGQGVAHLREQALSGEGDEWFHTKVARAALARGRQLEKEGK